MNTAFEILAALSFCHLLNDMMQSLIPAIYPILKQNFNLSFTQVGLITLVLLLTGRCYSRSLVFTRIVVRGRMRSPRAWDSRSGE